MTHRKTLLLAGLASLLPLGVSSARADFFDLGIRIGSPQPRVQRVWVEPVYETRSERIWIEPVFESRSERVYREPVYELRESKIWVPDRFEVRSETYRDHRGNRVTREVRILVERGHWNIGRERVLVREGRWEEVPQRVRVSEGRWEEVERRVIVRDGYWTDQVWQAERGAEVVIGYGRDGSHGYDRRNVDHRLRSEHRPLDRREDQASRRDEDRRESGRDYRTRNDHDRAAR